MNKLTTLAFPKDSNTSPALLIAPSLMNEDGNKQVVKQKVVVYWSKKFYDREVREHQSFLEFVEKFKQIQAIFVSSSLSSSSEETS